MRYMISTEGDYLRDKYDIVIGWGAKNEFERMYDEKVIKLDHLVDGNNYNVGKVLKNITVDELSVVENYKAKENVLVIIFPNIEIEILEQVSALLPNADTILYRLVKSDEKRSTYSTNKEDNIIYDYIKEITDNITYMDIGVCHPIVRNNTYYFYDNKYTKGVLVEPNLSMCELAKLYRPENIIVNCGASADVSDSELTYFYRKSGPGTSTFIEERTLKEPEKWEKLKVPVVNINKLIEQNFPDKRINVLDIDTEGMDYELLKALDTNRFRIDLICAERSKIYDINKLMLDKGYSILCDTIENTIYVRKE